MLEAKEISQLLAQRAEEVASYLFPDGQRDGNEFCVGSISGERGKSLKIHLKGQKSGVWSDFATGQSGDLLDLWSLKRNISLSEAIKDACGYLGVAHSKISPVRPLKFVLPQDKFKLVANNSPVFNYLIRERKLTPEIIKAFRVGENNREIVFPYYQKEILKFIKYISIDRNNGKKVIRTSKNSEPCLFGWHLIPPDSKEVTICEGEIDVCTLYKYGIPALSTPFGAGTGNKHKWLEYEFEDLLIFDEIFLCFDPDEAGMAATNELIQRLGRHRCRLVKLPFKDPNECLQKGVSKYDMQRFFDQSVTFDPKELKKAKEFVNEVIDVFYPKPGTFIGYHSPWENARGKILFRNNELSVWSGINSHGKSQFIGHLLLSFIQQGSRVCIASLELKPKLLLARLIKQASGLSDPAENFIRAIHDWFGNNLFIFDLVGTAKAKRLIEVFEYAHRRYGVGVFIIDSLMKLDISEEDYVSQKTFIEQLCDFKNQYSCHIHLISHPRKGTDETSQPSKMDVKGTGSITDLADNCFIIWRNKAKEELVRIKLSGRELDFKQLKKINEDTDCLWICDKNRNGDWEGKIALYFDKNSYQYLDYATQKPKPFVKYSELENSDSNLKLVKIND